MTFRPDLQAPADFDAPIHHVDREIYGMPAFATLPVSDLDGARTWYEHLGFVLLAEMAVAPQRLLHMRRYRYQDLLLVPTPPETGAATGVRPRLSFAHSGPLEELDEIATALRREGTGAVDGPSTTPWRAVEVVATDADGHQVVLTAPQRGPVDPDVLEQLGLRMHER